jgi:C1A family cysteine protease
VWGSDKIHLEIAAGHAVTAVGYDDFKECFIVA